MREMIRLLLLSTALTMALGCSVSLVDNGDSFKAQEGIITAEATEYWSHGSGFNIWNTRVFNNQYGIGQAASGAYLGVVNNNGKVSFWYNGFDGTPNTIKVYPTLINGYHYGNPGGKNFGPNNGLPVQVKQNKNLNVSISLSHGNQGPWEQMNFSWDIWLSWNKDNPGPDNEIMVWFWRAGNQHPAGSYTGDVTIAGSTWELWSGKPSGCNWYCFTFIRKSGTTTISLNLRDFVNHLKNKTWVSPDIWVTGVEFGQEVMNGKGWTDVNSYSFSAN